MAQARIKGLVDNRTHVPARKNDVNISKNNQVKYPGGATTIPSDQMKCNILKAAKMEEERKGLFIFILYIWLLLKVLYDFILTTLKKCLSANVQITKIVHLKKKNQIECPYIISMHFDSLYCSHIKR